MTVFLNHHVVAFWEKRVLKGVSFFGYLHNDSTMLKQKFQNNVAVYDNC